jgi:hypothetical protein
MTEVFQDDRERTERTLAVLALAEGIGRQLGADPLVLIPAAILHDVGPAADMLRDVCLPEAVRQEILDTIAAQCDREKIDTPASAALFDALLVADLKKTVETPRSSMLARRALTAAGRREGAEYLGL